MPRTLALILAALSLAWPVPVAADTVRTEIESIAARLPCFDTDDLLYDRMLAIRSVDISPLGALTPLETSAKRRLRFVP